MSAMLTETPSRIWRRIEAVEDRDMPSLPSLPGFEDSQSSEDLDAISDADDSSQNLHQPIHSTPALSSHYSSSTASRVPSSTASTQRFATSIGRPRSSSGQSLSKANRSYSFDISAIPSLPDVQFERGTHHFSDDEEEGDPLAQSKDSVPEVYLPPDEEDDDLSFSDRSDSPQLPVQPTPRKYFDTTAPLRSEPKPSPLDPYRNIAFRRPLSRTRTPSLSRTTLSPASSPANSTPQSTRSINRSLAPSPTGDNTAHSYRSSPSPTPAAIPLPRSNTASPAIRRDASHSLSVDFSDRDASAHSNDSMDITDAHISPMHQGENQSEIHHSHQQHSEDSRDPTFSSDGEDVTHSRRSQIQASPEDQPSSGASSNTQSFAFTPTPAFPRPRARFNLITPPADLLATPRNNSSTDAADEEEPLTPHTRRKSFLLSIVNSTTRPRMKMPTPHPRHRLDVNDMSTVEGSPGPSMAPPTPGLGVAMNLQSAFGGATPQPRPRLGRPSTHPLAQAFTASESESDSGGSSPSSHPLTTTVNKPTARRMSLGASPAGYDGAMDRASFISTASSHDLTTNIRANTSFDPSMGFGLGAQATGRFNAGKLNTYLHGLNRRLQEENEILIDRLRQIEEAKKAGITPEADGSVTTDRRQSGGFSRRSSARLSLGDVPEDVGGEGWMAEKAELEEMVEVYKDEIEKNVVERDALEKALEVEQQERSRDQERWAERMAEVEKGVEGIIGDLEGKLQAAETRATKAQSESIHQVRELELQIESLRAEMDLAGDRAEKAEKALSNGLDLGSDLKEANQRISNLMSDLRNSNTQLREMEQEVARTTERAGSLEDELKEEKELVKELEKELNNKMDELDSETQKLRLLQQELATVSSELDGTRAYVAELEGANKISVERLEAQNRDLDEASEQIHRLNAEGEDKEQRLAALEVELEQSAELARQMEEALDAAEHKMSADDLEMVRLKGRVTTLERERDRALEASRRHSEPSRNIAPPDSAELDALEEELDDAHREIARLNTVINSSPVRKTMDKAKDLRIDMLEKENEALLERIKAWKYNTADFPSTPSRIIANNMGISPAYRQMSIKTPKTPGGPLRDLTWLHNSTTEGEPMSPLVAEISRLRRELDNANESVDDKLDKLEDAGLGVVALTRKLEDARSRIVSLEDEIARLSRKDDRRTRRLEKARCQKCLTKVKIMDMDESTMDLSRSILPSEPPTPPTRTSEALKSDLRNVNSQLSSMKREWESERQQLIAEKGVLQDVANKLNDKIRTFAADAAKEKSNQAHHRSDIQADLDNARSTIAELEAALSTERAQLRSLSVEQNKVSLERENVLAQLKRTENDMDDVKQQLQRIRKDNQAMEKELRDNANVEQKARLLESRVAENAETIERLRQERSLLANDHKSLQRKFTDVSEHANRLRDEQSSSQQLHDNRRHQLDLYMTEIDELRRALSDQAEELHRVESEKKRISSERSEVSRTVAALESDLRRVKREAEAFGKDLKMLRSEKDKAESKLKEDGTKFQRAKKQADSQIRLLTEQLDSHKATAAKWRKQVETHVCLMDEQQLSAIRLQHNKECKGLIVQIRYLKAKFTREATLRFDLVYQKQYLMILLTRLEKSEKTIFSAISRIGGLSIEPNPPPRQMRKLKSVALMVVFMTRIRRSSEEWQKQCESKEAVAAALQDVRKRRQTRS